EARRPLTGIVEIDHEAVDETVGGRDLQIAGEILGHYDTSASGSRTTAARAATSPTMMRLGPASPRADTCEAASRARSASRPVVTRSSGRVPFSTMATGVAGATPASNRRSRTAAASVAPI